LDGVGLGGVKKLKNEMFKGTIMVAYSAPLNLHIEIMAQLTAEELAGTYVTADSEGRIHPDTLYGPAFERGVIYGKQTLKIVSLGDNSNKKETNGIPHGIHVINFLYTQLCTERASPENRKRNVSLMGNRDVTYLFLLRLNKIYEKSGYEAAKNWALTSCTWKANPSPCPATGTKVELFDWFIQNFMGYSGLNIFQEELEHHGALIKTKDATLVWLIDWINSTVLDFLSLSKIIHFDPSNGSLYVHGGVIPENLPKGLTKDGFIEWINEMNNRARQDIISFKRGKYPKDCNGFSHLEQWILPREYLTAQNPPVYSLITSSVFDPAGNWVPLNPDFVDTLYAYGVRTVFFGHSPYGNGSTFIQGKPGREVRWCNGDTTYANGNDAGGAWAYFTQRGDQIQMTVRTPAGVIESHMLDTFVGRQASGWTIVRETTDGYLASRVPAKNQPQEHQLIPKDGVIEWLKRNGCTNHIVTFAPDVKHREELCEWDVFRKFLQKTPFGVVHVSAIDKFGPRIGSCYVTVGEKVTVITDDSFAILMVIDMFGESYVVMCHSEKGLELPAERKSGDITTECIKNLIRKKVGAQFEYGEPVELSTTLPSQAVLTERIFYYMIKVVVNNGTYDQVTSINNATNQVNGKVRIVPIHEALFPKQEPLEQEQSKKVAVDGKLAAAVLYAVVGGHIKL